MLYHIVAMAKNRAIGKDNRLPWHFPEDMKHFKTRTTGSTVIMGRKTYESIGKPLPNRENFVLSRTQSGSPQEHLRFFNSLESALDAIQTDDAYIIGGAELYEQTMLLDIDGIYLTRIDKDYDGDAFYPEIPDTFEEVEIECLREKDPKIEVVFYERKS